MAITSLTPSTTQTSPRSRCLSPQMSHTSLSDKLWHTLQYFTSCLSVPMARTNPSTSSSSCLNTCKANRMAVFRPTPGNLAKASMACSNNNDG